ncbi:hypothetical protein [Flavobacterium piscinae]|uniref:hypothetical protein n=1 Tax=Flavobacterium piscinae TaxID=2506424 RepID=UPI002AAAFCFB|nr:hypothetical protein [Flavobacterium piscinae]
MIKQALISSSVVSFSQPGNTGDFSITTKGTSVYNPSSDSSRGTFTTGITSE